MKHSQDISDFLTRNYKPIQKPAKDNTSHELTRRLMKFHDTVDLAADGVQSGIVEDYLSNFGINSATVLNSSQADLVERTYRFSSKVLLKSSDNFDAMDCLDDVLTSISVFEEEDQIPVMNLLSVMMKYDNHNALQRHLFMDMKTHYIGLESELKDVEDPVEIERLKEVYRDSMGEYLLEVADKILETCVAEDCKELDELIVGAPEFDYSVKAPEENRNGLDYAAFQGYVAQVKQLMTKLKPKDAVAKVIGSMESEFGPIKGIGYTRNLGIQARSIMIITDSRHKVDCPGAFSTTEEAFAGVIYDAAKGRNFGNDPACLKMSREFNSAYRKGYLVDTNVK